MSAQRISVVLPVYNEAENIQACLRRLGAALAGVEHEVLVCYDFDADTTLPAIAAMDDRPASVRLVRNELGKGAANALRAGFKAATGDVVVTTMADLSDPPEKIPALAEHLRRGGYAVVAGSRYMRGGSQSGGPLLKRTFSRWAGLLLHWIAGIGTHDATNNFRAYSRKFLNSVGIESERGFEIALELTVKAQLMGQRVGEVPSSWTDRSAGESRFRMWAWMPNYLRWWLRGAREPLIVWGVFVAMLAGALAYVATYAAKIPFWDDLEALRTWLPTPQRTLEELWGLHNEHRIPLPRLVQTVLLDLTSDIRSAMFLTVAVYAAISAAMLLAARRLRGRSSWTDLFFPLLWLHVGNSENLLMGWQFSLALPTALVCAIVLIAITRPEGPTPRSAALQALCLVALPLCGGPGLTQAPPLVLGLAVQGAFVLRRRSSGSRAAGWILLGGALATVAVVGLYLVGFHYAPGEARTWDPAAIFEVSTRFLTLALGQAGKSWWPYSLLAIAIATALAIALCAPRRARASAERVRGAWLLLGLAASALLAFAIGHGRGGAGEPVVGWAVRYVGLPAPLLCWVYLAVLCFGGLFTSALVRGTLALGMATAVALVEVPLGIEYGEKRRWYEANLRADILAGRSTYDVYSKHAQNTYLNPSGFFYLFGLMAKHRLTPFDEASDEVVAMWTQSAFNAPIERIEHGEGIAQMRTVGDGFEALIAPPHSGLHLPVADDAQRVTGMFGVMPASYELAQCSPLRFLVILADASGRRVLLERVLDPVREPADRGPHGLDVALPQHQDATVVLRVQPLKLEGRPNAWGYWADIASP